MTPTPSTAVDPAVPGLLRQLLQQFSAADEAGARINLAQADALHPWSDDLLVGALCLGGAGFAAWLVGLRHEGLSELERYGLVLDAFYAAIEPPPDAADDHEAQRAQQLIDRFELPASARTLLDTVRAEFLITAGPLEEVPEASLAAMRHQQWALALRGFQRVQHSLQARTPRNVYGMASMCLHKLGRYAEAEDWAQQGLGEQARCLQIGPVHTEAELLRQWSGRRSPVISIICTSFNHERYIEQALRGFLSQTCSFPFEILVHDDASTDGTQRIIGEWQQRYPRIIKPLLQTENQYSKGGRPFETMLARAKGEFVATCEGDDFWVDPTKLQRQVGFLKSHPEYSCSAHNYYHYLETALTVKPWTRVGRDFVLSARQLMGVVTVLWLPTLVFRKTFSALPPERNQAAIGDQFITSYLGTLGRCMYFETLHAAVRRENEFSLWSPLPQVQKERMRVKTWSALVCLHERLGQQQAVADLMAKIDASTLEPSVRAEMLAHARRQQPATLTAA